MAPIAGSKRKRSRRSNTGPTASQIAPTQQVSKKRGRRSTAQLVERDESVEPHRREHNENRQPNKGNGEPEPHYQRLAAVRRGVSRHTIDAKWEPLSATAVDRISQLLNDVERSVVMRLQDERKRTQASTAVQMVSRRLNRKLTRGQPFPPSTQLLPEEDFDFEKILDSSRALEARLTPMLHSIELLKAETAKEEALLEADATTLQDLEANAKSEASRRRRAEKTLHDILRDDTKHTVGNLVEGSGLVYRKSQQRSLEITKTDESLGPIVDQLYNHLQSIQGNISQIKGLASAMDGSRAALQDVLLKHIGRTRSEQAILG